MFKIQNWKMPIYKNDLYAVLLNGILMMIIGGALAGLLDYLFGVIFQFPISFGLFLTCYMIGIRIRRSYDTYHVLYSLLALIFMILALMVSHFAYIFVAAPSLATFEVFLHGSFYLSVFMEPVVEILVFFKNHSVLYLFIGIVNVAIYIYAFIICYRLSKGRN